MRETEIESDAALKQDLSHKAQFEKRSEKNEKVGEQMREVE